MDKIDFLEKLSSLYAVANRGDMNYDEKPSGENWTYSAMAGEDVCGPLDHIMGALLKNGAITDEEFQWFHNSMGEF